MTIKKDTTKKKTEEVPKYKFSGKYFEAVGRRKRATARVRIYDTKKAQFIVNDKEGEKYFTIDELIKLIFVPLKAVGQENISVSVKVNGGGLRGQAEAVRHGIARALIKMDPELRATLKSSGVLTRDSRRKERKKPGLKRARRAPQWSKR